MFPVDFENFSRMFSGGALASAIAICAINVALVTVACNRQFTALQQTGYGAKSYLKWYRGGGGNYKDRFMLLSFMSFLSFCLLGACFIPATGENVASFIGFFTYAMFIAIFIKTEAATDLKIPLKFTKRLLRLIITFVVLSLLLCFAAVIVLNLIAYALKSRMVAVLRYAPLTLSLSFAPYVGAVAAAINAPFEKANNERFVRKAQKTLDGCSAVKIGITGSFGKTSVKEILTMLLSEKYSVLSTPQSYNTPLGIALTVKNGVNREYFIAEMGARRKGDIKRLCDEVKPSVGVLTGVNSQHAETFGSLENVKSAKFELFENLYGDKTAFFSADNEGSKQLYAKFVGKKYLAGINGEFVRAENIEVGSGGTRFTLIIKGEKPICCKTALVGEHNVSDICLAAAVAYVRGVSVEEIARGIEKCRPVEHRTQILRAADGGIIIDDAYNSSEDGAEASLKTLAAMNGKKTVITPGLVELGDFAEAANEKLGGLIAKYADEAIIVGSVNKAALLKGVADGNMPTESVKTVETLDEGVAALNGVKDGEVVLFLNDLPDNYR